MHIKSLFYTVCNTFQLIKEQLLHDKIKHPEHNYPGSEFAVASNLSKWKKLEPNEINFSQGFSQKVVSTSCYVLNSVPARGNFCCLLITFANSLDPEQAQ